MIDVNGDEGLLSVGLRDRYGIVQGAMGGEKRVLCELRSRCSTITMRSRLAKPISTRMCSAEYHGKEFVVVDKVSQNTVSLYAVCQ